MNPLTLERSFFNEGTNKVREYSYITALVIDILAKFGICSRVVSLNKDGYNYYFNRESVEKWAFSQEDFSIYSGAGFFLAHSNSIFIGDAQGKIANKCHQLIL